MTQAVEDLIALFPVQDDLLGAKHRQMLRGVRLLDPQLLNELPGWKRPVPE